MDEVAGDNAPVPVPPAEDAVPLVTPTPDVVRPDEDVPRPVSPARVAPIPSTPEDDEEVPPQDTGHAAEEAACGQLATTFDFSADVSQLMSLIINAVYSNKDIFLRELISNGSDALDKLRFLSLTDPHVLQDNPTLEIKLSVEPDTHTLRISDSGIGMDRDEMVHNLGTIARSGTKQFMEALQAGTSNMIGQYGVGFYSAFLVAKKVIVRSKKVGCEGHVWTSSGNGSFTVAVDPDPLMRGTEISLVLKEDCAKYAQPDTLKRLVQRHSAFIAFDIKLRKHNEPSDGGENLPPVEEEDDDEEEEDEKVPGGDNPTIETVEPATEGERVMEAVDSPKAGGEEKVMEEPPTTETVEPAPDEETVPATVEDEEKAMEEPPTIETVESPKAEDPAVGSGGASHHEWETLNAVKPIWLKSESEVTAEQYSALYKSISKDWDDYLAVKHACVDGTFGTVRVLIFVPKRAPFDLFEPKRKHKNVRLYARRVFITDEPSTALLPEYLGFVHAVVDSDDLPLNISRETLAESGIMPLIRKILVKKTHELLKSIAQDSAKYKTFYDAFSKSLKLGVHEEKGKRQETLIDLLRYNCTTSTEPVSLKQYCSHMLDGQKHVYFITGESDEHLSESPFLERFREQKVPVLLLSDPIDEYATQRLPKYRDFTLQNCAKAGINLDFCCPPIDTGGALAHLCEQLQKWLGGEKVQEVVISQKYIQSPCAISTPEFSWTANMERIMKAQCLRTSSLYGMAGTKKVLELNPNHRVVKALQGAIALNELSRAKDLAVLLFETALITSGFAISQPKAYGAKIYKLVSLGLSLEEENPEEQPAQERADPEEQPKETVNIIEEQPDQTAKSAEAKSAEEQPDQIAKNAEEQEDVAPAEETAKIIEEPQEEEEPQEDSGIIEKSAEAENLEAVD